MIIRRAAAADFPTLCSQWAIQTNATPGHAEEELSQGFQVVAEEDGLICGFAAARPIELVEFEPLIIMRDFARVAPVRVRRNVAAALAQRMAEEILHYGPRTGICSIEKKGVQRYAEKKLGFLPIYGEGKLYLLPRRQAP
jgi:hypothetical protein